MMDWLARIPLYWGVVMGTVGFAGMIFWVWKRPRAFIFTGAPDNRSWRDLRIWATILLVLQIIIYLVLG